MSFTAVHRENDTNESGWLNLSVVVKRQWSREVKVSVYWSISISHPHLWPRGLGSDRKNEVMDAMTEMSSFKRWLDSSLEIG